MRKSSISLFSVINFSFLSILALMVIYPVWYTFLISISRYEDAPSVVLWTPHIDFSAYRTVLESRGFVSAFFVSLAVTGIGVLL